MATDRSIGRLPLGLARMDHAKAAWDEKRANLAQQEHIEAEHERQRAEVRATITARELARKERR